MSQHIRRIARIIKLCSFSVKPFLLISEVTDQPCNRVKVKAIHESHGMGHSRIKKNVRQCSCLEKLVPFSMNSCQFLDRRFWLKEARAASGHQSV